MLQDYDFKVEIIRSERKTTTITVKGEVVYVRTNLKVNDLEVKRIIEKNIKWIKSKIKPIDDRFLFLGRKYTLEKIVSSDYGYQILEDMIILSGGKEADFLDLEDLILVEHQDILKEIIVKCVNNFPKKPNNVQIKRLKRSFGICHRNGNISIGLHCLKYSREFMEMVVYHELAHLYQMNHSAKFYEILSEYVKDHKTIKKQARL